MVVENDEERTSERLKLNILLTSSIKFRLVVSRWEQTELIQKILQFYNSQFRFHASVPHNKLQQ